MMKLEVWWDLLQTVIDLVLSVTVDREATSRHNETNASVIGQSSES